MPFRVPEPRELFDLSTYRRGLDYHRSGRVVEVHFSEDGDLVGRVRGSGRTPYSIHIVFDGNGDYRESHCTCPVGSGCKHVVASLLEAHERGLAPPTHEPEAPGLPKRHALWIDRIRRAAQGLGDDAYLLDERRRLYYVFSIERSAPRGLHLSLQTAHIKLDGEIGKTTEVWAEMWRFRSPPPHLKPIDLDIAHQVQHLGRPIRTKGVLLDGEAGRFLIGRILATGRARWGAVDGTPLRPGPTRPGRVTWHTDDDGAQSVRWDSDAGLVVPLMVPALYVDAVSGDLGPLEMPLEDSVLVELAGAPPVQPEESAAVREALARALGGPSQVLPKAFVPPLLETIDPQPTLTMKMMPKLGIKDAVVGQLAFRYGPHTTSWPSPEREFRRVEGDRPVVTVRHRDAEFQQLQTLLRGPWTQGFGLPQGEDRYLFGSAQRPSVGDDRNLLLMREVMRLEALGWTVHLPEEIELPARLEDQPLRLALQEDPRAQDWFSLSLGVAVEGHEIDLLPLILDVMRTYGKGGSLDHLPEGELLVATLAGRPLLIPAGRVKPIVRVLDELGIQTNDPIHATRAAELLEHNLRKDVAGVDLPARLRELGERMLEGERQVSVPDAFQGSLRPYQRKGLDRLQFWRRLEWGGILADDMGLGKTIQTIVHLLVEQSEGRLDRPCLIVAPTSLTTNWERELKRFAPDLRVLVLHGPGRASRFEEILDHDVVVTTYPLAARDRDTLARYTFHLLVLDEAHGIKNPRAATTLAIKSLQARHRLCLTGTPLQNNLEELFSLFDFLAPGLLGDGASFRKVFRTPIEKEGNDVKRVALARRIRPFLLRRTKDEVAKDLPPKTEMVEYLEIKGEQRDLYETIRLSMHERVREVLARQGLARSRIVVLDALLKLRQVCCDPRLVKIESAGRVQESAKLDRLMEMLPQMLSEGRRVLLFSQFTSMLALVEEQLERQGISYVKLTGQTEDRTSVVDSFQAEEVPLFLISLKAGGVGLNLTAADTVILYDPWWNPAVEDQAAGRAHRIGQSKPVFVHKLVVAGTVEEKILELQSRKAELARSLIDEEAGGSLELTEEDLEWLFAPPPSEP
jgi:superfamily II DNA or RNA helicase